MNPQTFIFIGRSGCGKGTQSKLLIEKLGGDEHAFYLETGDRFRRFIAAAGETNKRASAIAGKGLRQPDFLAVWMWANAFVEDSRGDEHIIIDGTPRSLLEAEVLHTAFSFYGREKPVVVHLKVSSEWSRERMLGRHRIDDDEKKVKERMEWYEKDVTPAIEFYRNHVGYYFLEIDGEKPIEEVHGEVMSKLRPIL